VNRDTELYRAINVVMRSLTACQFEFESSFHHPPLDRYEDVDFFGDGYGRIGTVTIDKRDTGVSVAEFNYIVDADGNDASIDDLVDVINYGGLGTPTIGGWCCPAAWTLSSVKGLVLVSEQTVRVYGRVIT